MNYKYIVKNSLLILITGFIISFSNFIFSPIYISKLGNDNFGILSLIISISFLFTTLFSINNVALIVRYSDISNPEKKKDFIGTAFVLQLLFMIFVISTILISKGSIIDVFFDKIKFDNFLKYALLIGALNSLQSIPLGYYWGHKLFLKYRMIPIIGFCFNSIFIYIYLYVYDGGIYDAINGIILSSLLLGIFSIYKFFNISRFVFNSFFYKIIIRFSTPIVIYSIFGLLVDIVIRKEIENFLSLDQIGLYSIIYLISTVPIIVLISVNNVWLPIIYTNSQKKNIVKLFNDYIYLSIRLLVILSVSVCLYSKEILLFFYDEEYINLNNASSVLIIMTIGNSLFSYLWIHLSNEMNYYKKTKGYLLTTLFSFAVTILLASFLISKFNFTGAAFISVISNFTVCFSAFVILTFSIGVKGNYFRSVLFYFTCIFAVSVFMYVLGEYAENILIKIFFNLLILTYIFKIIFSYFKNEKLTFN